VLRWVELSFDSQAGHFSKELAMHSRRREKLIDLAPAVPPSRSFPAVRVLRTNEELEAAQERARAFERRDAERCQRRQAHSGVATVLPLERSPESRRFSDLHPAGSGLSGRNRARRLSPETMDLVPADGNRQQLKLTRYIDTHET
jgi:hypothetical protein